MTFPQGDHTIYLDRSIAEIRLSLEDGVPQVHAIVYWPQPKIISIEAMRRIITTFQLLSDEMLTLKTVWEAELAHLDGTEVREEETKC